MCVSYITLAGSGGAAGGPPSAVGSPLGTDGHGLIVINWCLHALNRLQLSLTSRYLRIPVTSVMPAAIVCRHVHVFECIIGDPIPLDDVKSIIEMPWPAACPQAGSRLQPAALRCSDCRPTVHSPHPTPVTLYTGKTGEVQSRLI